LVRSRGLGKPTRAEFGPICGVDQLKRFFSLWAINVPHIEQDETRGGANANRANAVRVLSKRSREICRAAGTLPSANYASKYLPIPTQIPISYLSDYSIIQPFDLLTFSKISPIAPSQ